MKKKISDIIVFLVIYTCSQALIMPRYINGLDEIWQYNFARCIAEGMIPYKDFNLVTTPLFSMICGIALKIFGNNLITMRVLEISVFSIILYMAYKIFENLKVNKIIIYNFIVILFLLFIQDIGVEYNYLVLILSLLIIYLELKNTEQKGEFDNSIKYHLGIGLLAGLAITTKHTVGIIISIICIFYKIIFLKKDKIKDYIKLVIIRLSGASIPVITFLVYLIFNNAIYDFYDYCILGVRTFTNRISYLTLLNSSNYLIRFFAITVPIVIVYQVIDMIKTTKNKNNNKKLTIFAYGIATFVRNISNC